MGRMRNKVYLGENVKYPVKYQDFKLLEKDLSWEEEEDEPNVQKERKTC